MCLISAVIGEPYGITLAFLLILLMSADITAGLAVRAFNNTLTEVVIPSRGQKEELTAMLTAFGNKASTKSTEEIKGEE